MESANMNKYAVKIILGPIKPIDTTKYAHIMRLWCINMMPQFMEQEGTPV